MQNYNLIHDWKDVSDDSPGITEPVSLSEMKNYMRLQGFTDDNDSTATVSIDTDDDLIEDLISSAREAMELITGLSLIPKTLRVILTNLAGNIELPYGPIKEVTELLYQDDEDDAEDPDYENRVDDVKLRGFDFKQLRCPNACNMTLEYTAGYGTSGLPTIPKALKEAIMKEVLYRYEHRGDELDDKGVCEAAMYKAAPFIRLSWLA